MPTGHQGIECRIKNALFDANYLDRFAANHLEYFQTICRNVAQKACSIASLNSSMPRIARMRYTLNYMCLCVAVCVCWFVLSLLARFAMFHAVAMHVLQSYIPYVHVICNMQYIYYMIHSRRHTHIVCHYLHLMRLDISIWTQIFTIRDYHVTLIIISLEWNFSRNFPLEASLWPYCYYYTADMTVTIL